MYVHCAIMSELMNCIQILVSYEREPGLFCSTIPQTIQDSLHIGVDDFLQVCRDRRSWASLWLLTLLADARGARAAVFVLPSTGTSGMLQAGGATRLPEPHSHLWLLPSKFTTPHTPETAPVPVDLYALAAGFFLFPLQAKVGLLIHDLHWVYAH